MAIAALAAVAVAVFAVPALLETSPDREDSPSATQQATLVSVIDGDTIVVDLGGRERRVRLVGVDTPERGACYGKEATVWLTRQVPAGAVLALVDDSTQPNTDQYDRLLRYVEVDGTDLGLQLLDTGHDRPYDTGPASDHPRRQDYSQAATRAEDNDRGLWRTC